MFCKKCGQELNDNARFCFECGSAQKDEIRVQSDDEIKARKKKNEKYDKENIPVKKWTIMTIVGGLLTYLSVFHDIFFGLSGVAAVISDCVFTYGAVMLIMYASMLLGVSPDKTSEAVKKGIEQAEKKNEENDRIRRLNNEWNNAQRDYDRYNKK